MEKTHLIEFGLLAGQGKSWKRGKPPSIQLTFAGFGQIKGKSPLK